jgi:hypothetical protein
VSKRVGHANGQVTVDIYARAMKNDEATVAELWHMATAEIIGRTRKPRLKESPVKAEVIFGFAKPSRSAVNE